MTDKYPVIGMSPGNSYFKDEVVKDLLEKVVGEFGKAAVLIADVPAVSTYVALGYPENRAWRDKARPQGNALKNRVQRAMSELGYSEEQVRIVDWKTELEGNPEYAERYAQVLELYNSNPAFQAAAKDATREVLEYSEREISDLEAAVQVAVHYLLSEIAFMEFAPIYLKSDQAIYVYHRAWPIYEKYIEGAFDGVAKPNLGFLLVN